MKILLPNNLFGQLIMILFMLLTLLVPFVITLHVVLLVAPWWVALPCSVLAALATFVVCVKFKD